MKCLPLDRTLDQLPTHHETAARNPLTHEAGAYPNSFNIFRLVVLIINRLGATTTPMTGMAHMRCVPLDRTLTQLPTHYETKFRNEMMYVAGPYLALTYSEWWKSVTAREPHQHEHQQQHGTVVNYTLPEASVEEDS